MQISLVDTPEGPQIRPEGGSCSLAAIAMDIAKSIPIGIPGLLAYTVADGGVGRIAPTIAAPFVGVEACAAGRYVVGNEAVTGLHVRVITHPEAVFTSLPRNEAHNGTGMIGSVEVP